MSNTLIVIRGGGDLGSGVAHRLHQARYAVVILEIEQPTVIRRRVAFASAVYEGEMVVEGVTARRVTDVPSAHRAVGEGLIPVIVDPSGHTLRSLAPAAVVDARMAKRNLGTHKTDAPVVIGLGPGFVAGEDVHAVIETQRGHDLGRVIYSGTAQPNTGVPGMLGGEDVKRVLRAPVSGIFRAVRQIGQPVGAGEIVGYVDDSPVIAAIGGVLRGIIHDGLTVSAGLKIGDIDPRGVTEHCFTISDKARAIGGSVLEVLLHFSVLP